MAAARRRLRVDARRVACRAVAVSCRCRAVRDEPVPRDGSCRAARAAAARRERSSAAVRERRRHALRTRSARPGRVGALLAARGGRRGRYRGRVASVHAALHAGARAAAGRPVSRGGPARLCVAGRDRTRDGYLRERGARCGRAARRSARRAQARPKATVCGVDWPSMRDACARAAHEFGVEARARFVGGDLFDVEIPGQYDLVIMSQILHHFDEDACRRLLARACSLLAPGGRIAVCDFMISDAPPASEPVPRLFAAQMLGLTQAGDCYPVAAVRALLAEQGLVDVMATPLKGVPVHCVTGDRAAG
ncbi:SAM-dependent methyltransferase [Burkholderia humptydooensis]|uniref:SAM-dependent methyltransferase n=1 Tax=Burkholderia humptydooensis TaxID=430531 RepID=UPI0027E559E7|nr:methyltransferase [Burkholderia humptydooensis]